MFKLAMQHWSSRLVWLIAWTLKVRRLRPWANALWAADQRRRLNYLAAIVATSGWRGMYVQIDGEQQILRLDDDRGDYLEGWDEGYRAGKRERAALEGGKDE